MKKKIVGLSLFALLSVAVFAGNVIVKFTGPSGQGDIQYIAPATAVTNMVMGTGGLYRITLDSRYPITVSTLTISGDIIGQNLTARNGLTVNTNATVGGAFTSASARVNGILSLANGEYFINDQDTYMKCSGHLVSLGDGTFNLGSSTQQWNYLYLKNDAAMEALVVRDDATFGTNVTCNTLTASKPVFTDGSKVLVSKTINNADVALTSSVTPQVATLTATPILATDNAITALGTPTTANAVTDYAAPETVNAITTLGTPTTANAVTDYASPQTADVVTDYAAPTTANCVTDYAAPETDDCITVLGTPTTANAVTAYGSPTTESVVTNITLEYSGTLYDSTGAALTNAAGVEVSIITNVIAQYGPVLTGLGSPTTAAAITGFGAHTTAAAITNLGSATTAAAITNLGSATTAAAITGFGAHTTGAAITNLGSATTAAAITGFGAHTTAKAVTNLTVGITPDAMTNAIVTCP